jgi:glycosyltransferase involved in cell wall biosynthesis
MIKLIHKQELNSKKIAFLVQGICSPMFQIQSVPFLEELKKEYEIIIISLEEESNQNLESERFLQIYNKLKEQFNLALIKIRNLSLFPKIISQIIQITPQLFLKAKRKNFTYFHARGYLPAITLHYLKKFLAIKYIFDMRGVFVDELKLLQNMSEKNLKIKLWRHFEKKAIGSCEFTVVVSRLFVKYVKDIDPEKDAFIIKNSIVKNAPKEEEYNDIRREIRAELGVENKKVWVYSGSTHKWQLIPQMISLFKFASKTDTDLYFLIICRDNKEKIEKLFTDAGIPSDSYRIISVEQNRVKRYLIAGDVGILLREKSIINEVSDPLKFVEYIHAGLMVIISRNIGDTEEIVNKKELGIVLDSFEKSDLRKSMNSLNYMLKNRNPIEIIQTANTIYSFNKSLELYSDCYQQLIS